MAAAVHMGQRPGADELVELLDDVMARLDAVARSRGDQGRGGQHMGQAGTMDMLGRMRAIASGDASAGAPSGAGGRSG